jgi:hypothetical protein
MYLPKLNSVKHLNRYIIFALLTILGVSLTLAGFISFKKNNYLDPSLAEIVIKNRDGKQIASEIRIEELENKYNFEVKTPLVEVKIQNVNVDPRLTEDLIFIDEPSSSDEDKDLVTNILHVNDQGWQFDDAQVTLKKVKDQKINAIVTCGTWDFNKETGTCNKWEVADISFTDENSEFITFNVNHFSAYAGAYLEILNFHAHLTQGDNWEVEFNTYGTSDLTIEPAEDTTYGDDISYVGFYCGDYQYPQQDVFNGNKLHIPNYSCEGQISKIVNVAISPGPHAQRFVFGESDEIAHNFACDSGTLNDTCTVSTVQAMTNNYVISGTGNLTITSTGSLTTAILESFSIDIDGDVTIQASGSITGNVSSIAARDLIVAGSINASSKGYAGGVSTTGGGTGGGIGSGASGGANGGSYGGGGGQGTSSFTMGAPHGSMTEPNLYGAGGGGTIGRTGGAGGGSVKIDVSRTLDITGSINVNGGNPPSGATTAASGGGSGGSIWIIAPTITGNGSVTANGGNGYNSTSIGGGGGGGRIAMYYTTYANTLTTLTAYGGTAAANDRFGGAGTIYKKPSGQTYGDLIIDNNDKTSTTFIAPIGVTKFTQALTLNELILSNNGVLVVSLGDTIGYTTLTLSNAGVLIYNDGTFPLFNGTSPLNILGTGILILNKASTFTDMTVEGTVIANAPIIGTTMNLSGALTTYTNTTADTYRVDVTTSGDFTVTSSGTINLDGKGYRGGISGSVHGQGPGAGLGAASTGGSTGGSYGGIGGTGSTALAVSTSYGSVQEPDDLGSGGGGVGANLGGNGGGAIKLIIGGALAQGGTFSVNGTNGVNLGSVVATAGGAGGSVWIDADTITGSGTIRANGGNGYDNSSSDGGGGGGGRIALHYISYADSMTLTAYGGTPSNRFGGAGTIYKKAASETYGDVIIDNNNKSSTSYLPYVVGLTRFPSSITFNNMLLRNAGALAIYDTADVSYSNFSWTNSAISYNGGNFTLIDGNHDITVDAGGVLIINSPAEFQAGTVQGLLIANSPLTFSSLNLTGTLFHYVNTTTEAYKIDITTTGDLTIANTAIINLNGRGFAGGVEGNGYGPGGGRGGTGGSSGQRPGGGAGHGGVGETKYYAGGVAYGSETSPVNLGSGGGGSYSGNQGGAGGGAIKLVSGGTLSLGAAISANGTHNDNAGGDGSGGSIYLIAETLDGNGNLSAIGGTNTYGGDGAGGRIAIWSGNSSYSGSASVLSGGTAGAGTYFTEFTGPEVVVEEICSTAENGCTEYGEGVDPQEAYSVNKISGTVDESDTSLDSATVAIEDTDTGKWYSPITGLFDQNSIYYFDVSTLDQTLPYTGSVNWSVSTTGIPFVIDNTYAVSLAFANPQITTYESINFVFSNSPPEVSALSASQASSGLVNISYGVTDIELSSTSVYTLYNIGSTLSSDLDTGTGGVVVTSVSHFPSSGTIMVDDEFISYTGKSGSTLTGITRGANNTRNVAHTSGDHVWVLATAVTGNVGPGVTNGTGKSIVWNAKSDINGLYTSALKVRVLSNDGASSSMLHYLSTNNMTVDTQDPIFTSTFKINNSIDGTSIIIPCTDDSTLYMKVGTPSDLSGISAVPFESPQVAADFGITVTPELSIYGQCIDAFSNATTVRVATIPAVTPNMFYQDVSNIELEDYRLFIAWGTIAEPALGFDSYKLYRKINDGSYSLLTSITDRTLNYYVDQGLSNTSAYSYKIAVVDDNGNISAYSAVLTDTPDGSGGTDLSVPSVSDVVVTSVSATQATITWTTNKFSNSAVYFEATPTYPGSNKADYERSQGVPSMETSHSVILSGLTPSTTYSYLVESVDASDNSGTSSNNDYKFTTTAGPVISNVAVTKAFDEEVTITWNTSVDATSEITYSENADLSSPTYIEGSDDLTQNHSVTITELDIGSRYFFYVTSTDENSNSTVDKNIVGGVVYYYTFSTTADERSPIISDVTTTLVGEKGATITWLTDEESTSIVNWGLTNSLGSQVAINTVYTTHHSISLLDLSANTPYYYQVVSADRAGNQTTGDTIKTFTTNDVTTVETVTTVEIQPDLSAAGLENEVADALSSIVESASTNVINRVLAALSKNPNIDGLNEDDATELLVELTGKAFSAPTVGGSKVTVEAGPTFARVTWVTDKPANSLVAYVKDVDYDDSASNPYPSEVGDSNAATVNHEVVLEGLEPETTYHIQARSNGKFGGMGQSLDTVFSTTSLLPNINDIQIQQIKESGVELSWETNIPTRSNIIITESASGETQVFENPNFIRDHNFDTDELSPSTGYTAQVVSIDEAGEESESSVLSFFTTLNDNPPQISDVRVVTSLIPGKVEQVQTIISWKTNKPSTSKVLFEEGVRDDGELSQSTSSDTALKKDHIIISSSFAPGKVYSYKVESVDTGGNTANSENFTLLTPRPRESVVDLIVKNLEEMFGFLR